MTGRNKMGGGDRGDDTGGSRGCTDGRLFDRRRRFVVHSSLRWTASGMPRALSCGGCGEPLRGRNDTPSGLFVLAGSSTPLPRSSAGLSSAIVAPLLCRL